MAKILVTWELGGGLGHLTYLRPIVAELLRRGHQVSLALRVLNQASEIFGDLDVTYWQAPFRHPNPASTQNSPASFVRLLANIGFGDYGQLSTNVSAWRSLFEADQPDLVLFEHSPTALLAAREFDFRRAVIGAGFWCPPTEPDLPQLRPPSSDDEPDRPDENRALQNARRLLESRRQQPIERVADLYRDVDDTLLCTFAELDHFGQRPSARYWGLSSDGFGRSFKWPAGSGQKIFAYLKPCPALPALLQCLATWRFPTVGYIDRLDSATANKYATATLQLYREPLNMRQASAECDLAILNAGHGALAAMLLAGKPAFLLPMYREQLLQTVRTVEHGYAEFVTSSDVAQVEPKLRKMFASNRYREASRGFAAKYADYDAAKSIAELASHLESLLVPPRKP